MPPLITPAGEARHSVNSAARVWRKRKREAERVRARARPRRFLPSFPPPTLRPLRRRFSAISGYHIPRVPSLASAVPRHSLSRRPLYHVFAVFPFLVMHLRSMSRASCSVLFSFLSLFLSLSTNVLLFSQPAIHQHPPRSTSVASCSIASRAPSSLRYRCFHFPRFARSLQVVYVCVCVCDTPPSALSTISTFLYSLRSSRAFVVLCLLVFWPSLCLFSRASSLNGAI